MTRPKLEEVTQYFTTGTAAAHLQMTRRQLRERIDRAVFPPPTKVNENKVKLFDTAWMERAELIIRCERGLINPTQLEEQLAELEKGELNEQTD